MSWWSDDLRAQRAGKMTTERHIVCGTCLHQESVVTESNAAARRHFLIAGWTMNGEHGWICGECDRARRTKPDLVVRRKLSGIHETPVPLAIRDRFSEARDVIRAGRTQRRGGDPPPVAR